ncbi:MAG: cell division protein FtsZ [Pseudomonadota bacterium]|nr:cell division protein FtsZ [Pseudomonadota bacterium]
MTINLTVPQHGAALQPRITVIGVGGAGGNAVNNMISAQLDGVEFLVANTDSQSLAQSLADRKIQLGHQITNGLGAGSRPEIGRASAEEAIDELIEHLQSVNMVFVTAGMGGGTGTGAAPVIARLAREHGILTVGVVTKPFQFEGIHRMRLAEAGIEEMQQYVDTLIVIPNQNLFRIANEKTTFADAFSMADQVLHSGVRGVTDLMVVPGLINLDFADIRTVMSEMGKAMMGTGEAEGEERARHAAEAAISNPLLDEVSMKGARGVLINITGGPDMTLFEVDEAANRIGDEVDTEANIIFGSTMDPALEGKLRVSVVATGIDAEADVKPRPVLKVYTNQPRAEDRPEELVEEISAEPVADHPELPMEAPAEPVASGPVTPTRSVSPFEMPHSSSPRIMEKSATEAMPIEVRSGDEADDIPEITTAVGTGEAFMPPPAIDPKRTTEPSKRPDPFREADMINGGTMAPPRRKGPSLFQRMTGAAKTSKKDVRPAVSTEPPVEPAVPVESSIERPNVEAPEIESPRAESSPAPRQSRLEDLTPSEAPQAAQSEEDLLDIPAFLRRQAN